MELSRIGMDKMELSGIGIDKMELTPCLFSTTVVSFAWYHVLYFSLFSLCLFPTSSFHHHVCWYLNWPSTNCSSSFNTSTPWNFLCRVSSFSHHTLLLDWDFSCRTFIIPFNFMAISIKWCCDTTSSLKIALPFQINFWPAYLSSGNQLQ